MTKTTKQLSAMAYRWFAAMALIAVCSLNAVGQVSTTVTMSASPILGSPFSSLAQAITAINALTITGPVVATAAAGTETAPAGTGYYITATGTVSNTILIQGTATTTITAGANSANGNMDAIFKIIGGDYITIQNFTMQENTAANTVSVTGATNTMTEAGVLLIHASATNGAQNNTIQNNIINLLNTTANPIYANCVGILSTSASTTSNASPGANTSTDATSTAGTNSNNKIYGNTISNVANGIYFISAPVTATVTETGNDIGGTSLSTANNITFGTTAVTTGPWNRSFTSIHAGIAFRNTGAGNSVRFNTVTSNNVAYAGSAGVLGISVSIGTAATGVTYTTTFSDNNLTLNNSGVNPTNGIDFGYGISTGTIVASNNTIIITQNASAATSNALRGIHAGYANATNTCNSNNITVNLTQTAGVSSGNLNIIDQSAASTTITGNNNTITVNQTGSGTGTFTGNIICMNQSGAATTSNALTNTILVNQTTSVATGINNGLIIGIRVNANIATINVTTNNAITFKQAQTGSGSYGAIPIAYVDLGSNTQGTVNITGNTFNTTASTLRGTGGFAVISHVYNTAAPSTLINIKSNTVNVDRVATAGAVSFFNQSSTTPSTAADSISSNSITFTNLAGSGAVTIIQQAGGPTTPATLNKSICNNTINVSGTSTGAFTGISFGYSTGVNVRENSITYSGAAASLTGIITTTGVLASAVNTISTNTFSMSSSTTSPTSMVAISGAVGGNFSITANVFTALNFSGVITGAPTMTAISVAAGTPNNIFSNSITNITAGASGTANPIVDGILLSGGTTNNVFRNSIYGLTSNCSGTTGVVNGVRISAGTTNNVYNNRIGSLTAPVSGNIDGVRGISITSTTASSTQNIYYNTVRINPSSSALDFGSSGIFHTTSATATTSALNIRNNIIINNGTSNGLGVTAAYRRSSTTLTNFASTSNNNNLFAPIIFTDGINSDGTIGNYQTRVGPTRETNSFSSNTTFLSTTGGNANFLKVDPSIAQRVESGAVNIATYTDDFEGTIRQGNPGYLTQVNGGGTAPDVGADEYDGIPASVCGGTPAASTISAVTNPLCSGNGTTLSLSTVYTDLGIVYQWQVASVSGGPYVNMGTGSTQATGNLAATMYYICVITCTNSTLSYTTAEYTLTVNPAQAVSVTPSSVTVCSGASTPLLANNESYTVTGTLQGSQEVPPVVTPATGTVNAVYNGVTNVLTMNVAYNGLTGTVTAANIHGPATAGVNAGVLYGITPNIVALGGTSGNLTGTVTLSAADETSLYAGLLYVNIQTTTNAGGEIRAQLTATVNTPTAYSWTPNTNITNNTIQNPSVNPTANTTYTVQVTGTGACTATNTSVITTKANPSITSFTATPSSICDGSTFNLSATGSGSVTRGTVSANSGVISVSIPDNIATGNTTTLSLSGATGNLASTDTVQVGFSITHTFDGDLDIFLVGPSNCGTMEISTDNGSTGDNYTSTIVLTPSANTIISSGTAPFTATYTPEKDINTVPTLSGAGPAGGGTYSLPTTALAGCPVNGTWTLFAGDDANGDLGTITNFSLSIKTNVPGPYIHAFSGNGSIGSVSYSGVNNEIGTATVSSAPVGSNTYTVITTAVNGCTATTTTNASVQAQPTANAGGNASVCSDATYTLSGATAANQSSVAWSTAGDGTFDNAALVNATYTPGANDITNGTVVLTLQSNATSPCTGFVTSNMTLTIVPAATANAGGNASICETGSYTLSGAIAANNTGVSWSSAGDGTFSPNNTTLNATYNPGPTDITNGAVQLTLTATGNAPCGNAVSNMTLGIEAIPTANAGADANACASGYVLNGSVAGSATGGTWNTSGDGSFSPNAATLNATYIAGPNDITNGTVTLTLTTTGSLYCTAVNDNVVLTIFTAVPATPSAVTGVPASVCPPTGAYTLSTSAAGATSFNWYLSPSTNGVTFLTPNGANTIDVSYQTTTNSTYSIRVEAINACGTSASYATAFTRRSVSVPAAVIGDDFACPNDIKTYSHVAVGGATSYQWTAPAGCYFDGNVLNTPPYVTTNTSVSVTFPIGYAGGVIGVAAQVGCFTSAYKNITVNNAPSIPGLITGLTTVCSPQAGVSYSITNTPGLTYTWLAPANATIATGQGTNAVTVNYSPSFAGGKLEVVANSACGTSLSRKLTIGVNPGGGTTPRPSSITGQLANLCGANGVQLTANPFVAGATYTFSSNVPGATLLNTVNNVATFNFPTGWANGTVSVIQQNACATASLPRTVDIKSRPSAPVITGPVNVAANTSGVAYSVPSLTPTVTYTWFVPAGATVASGQGTNAITVNFGVSGGQVKCFEANGCGNATGVLNVSVPRLAGSIAETDVIDFSIYPNPADNYVTVQFASQSEATSTVNIIDLTGKVVSVTRLNTINGINTNTIDVSQLAKGMYLVNVQTPDGSVQTRIAIQ